MTTLIALIKMARPLQLISIGLVFVLGVMAAFGSGYTVSTGPLLWAIVPVLSAGITAHYANEYADYETDALTTRTPYSGGSGVLPSGVIPRRTALIGAWVTLIIGAAVEIVAVLSGIHHPVAALVWLLIIVGAWMYSLPPLSLAWHGWGEIDNALLGGMMMPLYGYTVISGRIDAAFLLACLPFTMLVFTNLLATTWPDRAADAAVGKRTLATRWRIKPLRALFIAVMLGSFLMLPVLCAGGIPKMVIGTTLLVIPIATWAMLTYAYQEDPTPTVWTMVLMLLTQLAGWGGVSLL